MAAVLQAQVTVSGQRTRGENLWQLSVSSLSQEQKELIDFNHSDRLTVLKEVVNLAEDKKEQCLRKRWTIKKRKGGTLILRDVFEKIAVWAQKFREIGDIAVQYDPVHAALPWAGVRLLLQLVINESQPFGAMLEGLEYVSNLIARYAIVEELYLSQSSVAIHQLSNSIVKLYSSILIFLGKAHGFFDDNTAKRLAKSVVKLTDQAFEDLVKDTNRCQKDVDTDARLVDSERQRNIAFTTITMSSNLSIEMEKFAAGNEEMRKHTEQMLKLSEHLSHPVKRVAEQLSEITDFLDTEKRLGILQWLSTVPYEQHHQNVRKDRLLGSGMWLLSKSEFTLWRSSSVSSILWLHGIPGSGKTKLVSLIIDYLIEESKTSQTPAPIAYFYCARDNTEPERAEPEEILRSIARQLSGLDAQTPVREPARKKYEDVRGKAFQTRRLALDEIVELILVLTAENPATLIIDALDECDPLRRHELLTALDEIIRRSTSVVNVFVSSRDNSDIVCRLDESPNLYINAQDNSQDIKNFILLEVENAIQHKRLLNGQVSLQLKRSIVETLENGAQGMFRWVSLQLQNLCDPRRMRIEADVQQELGHLPKTLADLYAVIYKQILDSGQHSRQIAERVLKWLLIAQRPLKPAELLAAVSVDYYGNFTRLNSQDILNITCNLVVLDKFSDAFRYAHLSVLEYLETQPEYSRDNTHLMAAERCLQIYLPLPTEWVQKSPENRLNFENTSEQDDILRDYGKHYWPEHASAINQLLREQHLYTRLATFLFQSQEIFRQWRTDVKWISPDALPSLLHDGIVSSSTPFFTICNFGLTEQLRMMNKSQINAENYFAGAMDSSYRKTAQAGFNGFQMAISRGHYETAQVILDAGIDLTKCTTNGETPIALVVANDHAKLIPLLVRRGVDPNAKSHIRPKVVGLQIAYGRGEHRPRSSVGFRHAKEGIISAIDEDIECPLHTAAFQARTACVNALLSMGADVNVRSSLGANPLHKALEGFHIHIAKILLEHGADSNAPLLYGRTPLHYAAAQGQVEAARLLLAHGANPLVRDMLGKTPYEIAQRYGKIELADILNPSRFPHMSAPQQSQLNLYGGDPNDIEETGPDIPPKQPMNIPSVVFSE